MFKSKLSLEAFAAAISQSVYRANEMLHTAHISAINQAEEDDLVNILPPPLVVSNVKIRVHAHMTRAGSERGGDMFIDLNRPDGNFHGEFEFSPLSADMLKSASGGKRTFPARPANSRQPGMSPPPPPIMPPPSPDISSAAPEIHQPAPMTPDSESCPLPPPAPLNADEYDHSDTPRNYN